MCLVALHWDPQAEVPLVLVANRDEFRARPTEAMHWWTDESIPMLAGRDLQAGGTWFAIDRNANFALITNIRPGYVGAAAGLSRGALPHQFLQSGGDIERFHSQLLPSIAKYGGFNLLLGNRDRLFWFSSDHPQGRWLDAGVHVLSNDALDTPWPKAELARQQIRAALPKLELGTVDVPVLTSTARFPESELPQTGVPPEWESLLSAQTILGEKYGTRSRTWLRLYQQRGVSVTEAQYSSSGEQLSIQQFNWVEECSKEPGNTEPEK